MKKNLSIVALVALPFMAFSQHLIQKCASNDFVEQQFLEDSLLFNKMQSIENQIEQFSLKNEVCKRTNDSIVIPIVVHVLYHTAAENLSCEQIQSQIDALNRDFNKQNTDLIYVPAIFKNSVANCNIQFVLANRDESGNEVNGIIRLYTGNKTWSNFDDIKLSSKGGSAAWDASKYLNIWVGNLGSNVLAFSSFPGMRKEKDGIVIAYSVFGTIGNLPENFNQGRTCVHEVGHWLNLYHLTGDSPCGDDHVSDTPTQYEERYSKPTYPQYSRCNGVSSIDMMMNFMSYVDDTRMYMFTNGQKLRMWALFEVGGSRESIRYSNGWIKTAKQPSSKDVEEIIVYPNPVEDELNIKFKYDDPVLIQIIDITGKILYENQMASSLVNIDINEFLSGIYFLRIIKNSQETRKMFVK